MFPVDAAVTSESHSSHRKKYQEMFDPRLQFRAPWTRTAQQPQPHAHGPQAEYVTGTHLYAFLAGSSGAASGDELGVLRAAQRTRDPHQAAPAPLADALRAMKERASSLARRCCELASRSIAPRRAAGAPVCAEGSEASQWRWSATGGSTLASYAEGALVRSMEINFYDALLGPDSARRCEAIEAPSVTARVTSSASGAESGGDALLLTVETLQQTALGPAPVSPNADECGEQQQHPSPQRRNGVAYSYSAKIRLEQLLNRSISLDHAQSTTPRRLVAAARVAKMDFYVRAAETVAEESADGEADSKAGACRGAVAAGPSPLIDKVQLICVVVAAEDASQTCADSIYMLQIKLSSLTFTRHEERGNGIDEQQHSVMMPSLCKVRLLPFKGPLVSAGGAGGAHGCIAALHCQGARGMVAIVHSSGKLLVIDLEDSDDGSDDGSDDDSDSDRNT